MNNLFNLASIVRQVDEKKGNFKNIILKQKKNPNYKQTYASVIKTLKLLPKIKQFINDILIPEKIKIKNIYLFSVQINEYFNKSKRLKLGGSIQKIIKKYHIQLEKMLINQDNFVKKTMFFRVKNSEVFQKIKINKQQDDLIPNLYSTEYQNYQILFQQMQNDLFLEKNIIIQGKSSCLTPYFLMNNLIKQKIFDIIDCCAAPGNKTLQLSEYNQNGKIFAFEKNKNRYQLLNDRMNFYNAKNVETIFGNFLECDPLDVKFQNVKYIMADPSCSGSGMLNNFFFQKNEDKDQERLQKLAKFQKKIIMHAMKFKNVKKIAYSTCSIYEEENELVVQKILQKNKEFKLLNISKNWNDLKGINDQFNKGSFCIRTDPNKGEIDGFFVAVFKRKKQNQK